MATSRSVVVIRSVQRRSEDQKRALTLPSPRRPERSCAPDDSLIRETSRTKAEKNRWLGAVSGKLIKYTRRGLCGLGGEAAYPRWFELDPSTLTLSYWKIHDVGTAPKKVLSLDQLVEVETNPRHNFIFLRFYDQKKTLNLKAETQEDFQRWMTALENYGADCQTETVCDLDASPTHDF
mmetsp:Transcript_72980/g.120858  ORF Transcript_72980/g.120858 Transcript_72980/m.120858 type:complete len:179 (+) Transcript_72980:77-613(+)